MAEEIPFWYTDALAWDNVVLGDIICPGSANSIENLSSGRKVDIKEAPGKDGASLVDQGKEPAKFTIVCTLATPQELREWSELVNRVRVKQGEAPEAFSCAHPQLAMLNITSCYVLEVSGLDHQGAGVWVGKLSCLEFIPLKGSKGGAGKVKNSEVEIRDAGFIIKNRQGRGALQESPGKTVQPPKP